MLKYIRALPLVIVAGAVVYFQSLSVWTMVTGPIFLLECLAWMQNMPIIWPISP